MFIHFAILLINKIISGVLLLSKKMLNSKRFGHYEFIKKIVKAKKKPPGRLVRKRKNPGGLQLFQIKITNILSLLIIVAMSSVIVLTASFIFLTGVTSQESNVALTQNIIRNFEISRKTQISIAKVPEFPYIVPNMRITLITNNINYNKAH